MEKQTPSLLSNRNVWLIGTLLFLRVIFLLLGDGTINGDGTLYVRAAQEILLTGHLPPARFQSLGFAVVLAPVIALTGESAIGFNYDPKMLYTGDRIANAIHAVHVAMDLVIVLILIREAAKLLAGRTQKPFVVTGALTFLALQPFTATMAAFAYPDHMCMFFFFVGGYLIVRTLSGSRGAWGLAIGSAMLGIAGLIRFDMIPVCGALLLVLWLVLVRQRGARASLGAVTMSAALFLAVPAAMSIFQYWSTGEIGYVRTQTTQNGDNLRGGYHAWLRTWIILVQGEAVVFSNALDEGPSWVGFDLNAYPRRAFKSDQQRNEIAKLLDAWRQGGYSEEVDAGFRKIAEANRREHPITSFALVPAGRMLHYWINLEGARAIQVTLGIEPPWSRVATALVFPFRLLFVSLAAVGFFVVWIERRSRILRWGDDLDFARVCSLMVILRTGELGVLGLFMVTGLMETRYVIVALPAMLLLAVVGLRRIAGADEPLTSKEATNSMQTIT